MSVSTIARAVVRNKVRDAAQRHRGFEPIRMAYNPVGHIAAITSASHAHTLLIYPRIFPKRRVQAIHDGEIVLAAPFTEGATLELLPIARRAARIRKQHRVTLRRIDLKL